MSKDSKEYRDALSFEEQIKYDAMRNVWPEEGDTIYANDRMFRFVLDSGDTRTHWKDMQGNEMFLYTSMLIRVAYYPKTDAAIWAIRWAHIPDGNLE